MYSSNQHDSQPEWRLPAPPRRPEGQSDVPPPQPPRPQVAPYSPATYGQISTSPNPSTPVSGSADSRTWGVRYNNQQQLHPVYAPPPLPPRPSSTNEQPYAYAQSQMPGQPPPLNTSSSPPPPGHVYEYITDAQTSSASNIPPPYVSSPASLSALTSVPPPPPKIPQDAHPAAHQASPPVRPPLLAQGVGPAATLGSYGFRSNTNSGPTGPSALGPGTPSDWEHLGHTTADFDDAPWFPDRPPAHQNQDSVYNAPNYGTRLQSQSLDNTAPPPSQMEPDQRIHPPPDMVSRPDPVRRNDSISPISPVTTFGSQPLDSTAPKVTGHASFTPPPRVDSVSSAGSFGDHTESIDNVIDAWVQPLSAAPKLAQQAQPGQQTQQVHPERGCPILRPSSTHQSNEGTLTGISSPIQSNPPIAQDPEVVASTAVPTPLALHGVTSAPKPCDPYEDLDPWSKSSLTRYVAMLRKEAVADSDEERFKIFTAFMAKETKLREILYNIEHDTQDISPAPRSSVPTPKRTLSRSSDRKLTIDSGLIPVESDEVTSPAATTEYGDDIDDTASEFSSGGRPIQAKLARRGSQWRPKLSTLPGGEESATNSSSHPSRKFSIHESADKHVLEPLVSNPPQPIYTPFQYTEGPQRGSDKLTFARPAYEAYSDLRQSAGSGRIMSNAPAITSQSRSGNVTTIPATDEHDETFLGLIRHKSTAYRELGRPGTTPVPPLPESLRQGRPNSLLEELRSMVWKPLDKQSESSWHITTRQGLEKFSDDFSYIQESVDKWELSAKDRRHRLDEQRMVRQEESEEQIDNLFNGKEIGYADINTLEEDFRQTEARVQLDEEREEVENFIAQVFNPLDERLKTEISILRQSYDSALSQLDRDQKGKNSPTEQCSPSVTMNLVNDIHRKLELRFQKRLELALDCERRRKKAERRPLVFMGDMASLRELDGDFDRMEKRNILEAAKDCDDRANRLMDSFDDAILHGLGANQGLLDELTSKVARLDPTSLRASGLPDAEIEQVLKSAATFAASLRTDSEAILRSSGIADLALNEADYNVAVAEARYSNSEPEIFQRLEEEKKKEDDVLLKDMDSKLESIQRAPHEIESTIRRLLEGLSKTPRPPTVGPTSAFADDPTPSSQTADVPPILVQPPTAVPAPPSAAASPVQDLDVEHKERMRRALEEAKKRNAARANH